MLSSNKLKQKANGYNLAAFNAASREQNNKTNTIKITSTTTIKTSKK